MSAIKVTPRAELFARKVKAAAPEECWEWLGAKNAKGYGVFSSRVAGKPRRDKAHRFAFEMANGPIPAGLWVLHRCDNPGCVNPTHLFLGTPADNSHDMVKKGRNYQAANPERVPRGEAVKHAKLTAEQVHDVHTMRARGETYKAIAEHFGVTPQAIFHIVKGKNWRHLK